MLKDPKSSWPLSMTSTLELQNKDRRAELRQDLRRTHTKLYTLFKPEDHSDESDDAVSDEVVVEGAMVLYGEHHS